MIQSKAKNKYWQAGRRWRTCWFTGIKFKTLDFQNYQYIIGDKIYTEANDEAEEAFKTVLMWVNLQA